MADAPSAYPLAWPSSRPRTAPADRRAGRFATTGRSTARALKPLTLAEARTRLQGELDRVGATSPVLSTDVELRLDGQPRSGREPGDPGAVVYFLRRGRPYCMASDAYSRVADNVAALAAHIEAMRLIERHGVGTLAEMFAGFAALPAPRDGGEPIRLPPPGTR